jgi:ElaB/YqjD/DUF883 family membrane-anchored ribosome-binding protein
MVDRTMADAPQNASGSTRETAEAARDASREGVDAAREHSHRTYDAARDYAGTAREYANAGLDVATRMSDNLSEFVRQEPWIAIAAAFAVGYVAARIMRRLSI